MRISRLNCNIKSEINILRIKKYAYILMSLYSKWKIIMEIMYSCKDKILQNVIFLFLYKVAMSGAFNK